MSVDAVEDVHPEMRQAAIAWLYEPDATMVDVGEEFGYSQSWVSRAVKIYSEAQR